MEVTVLDEDKNKVYEFLGKIEIPLINVQNGKRKVYALKDKKLTSRTKGCIELELDVIYNPVKAIIKTVNPRDEKYIIPESKFKVQVSADPPQNQKLIVTNDHSFLKKILSKNIARCNKMYQSVVNTVNYIYSLFQWQNPIDSFVGLIVIFSIFFHSQFHLSLIRSFLF